MVTMVAAAALAVAVLGRPRRVAVAGASMEPGLLEGDHLLVWRTRRVAPGQVVAVEREGRLIVKRVVAIGPEGVTVLGDNPGQSTDSRHFGPVAKADVVGRAVYRYAPAGRAGWVD